MEENLLLDAIERYRNGEMNDQEKAFFEELRKNNSDIDQIVADHNFFLDELEKMSEIKALKHTLNEVESKLVNEGVISRKEGKLQAKLVYLWNRYKAHDRSCSMYCRYRFYFHSNFCFQIF